jgi:hypothetical protein
MRGSRRPIARRIMAVGSSTLAALTLAAIMANGAMGTAGPTHIQRQPGAPAHVHYLPVSGPGHVQSNLVYHGGPVVQQMSNTYAIFWEPPKLQNGDPAYIAPGYNAGLKQYFNDIGGTGLYNINTQYYQVVNGNKQFIKNVSALAGSWVDTGAYPASGCTDPATPGNCLTDAQIQAEVSHAIQHNGWSASPTNSFYVFTARGEGSCFGSSGSCAFTTYCGYHGHFGATIYANMPYGASFNAIPRPRLYCTRTNVFPNQRDLDMETSILSHEHIEIVTDPMLNAWYDSSGQEIADLCSYNFGTRDEDGGLANQLWNGHFYLLQQEWDNVVSGCAQDGP